MMGVAEVRQDVRGVDVLYFHGDRRLLLLLLLRRNDKRSLRILFCIRIATSRVVRIGVGHDQHEQVDVEEGRRKKDDRRKQRQG